MHTVQYNQQMVNEFLKVALPICTKENVMLMHKFIQHGKTSCLEHSIAVAYTGFQMLEAIGIKYDKNTLIRGALLHDYFLYDWHKPHGRWHGFKHPGIACKNASRDFELNEVEKNIIIRHMFPLVPIPPKSMEGAIVCLVDKWCSIKETFQYDAYKNYEIVHIIIREVEQIQAEIESKKELERLEKNGLSRQRVRTWQV